MSTARKPKPPQVQAATKGSHYLDEYDPTYPDSDGKPRADNTTQERWIATIKGGLDALLRDRQDVFVAADLLWYPVEGKPKIRRAPDALVAFGRPKGNRHSYKTWVEDGVAPHVVFEILSPGNTPLEMVRKLGFYERYGVEEYYMYDPDDGDFQGWIRTEGRLEPIPSPNGWTSPRLGVTFEAPPRKEALIVHTPDGGRFEPYLELYEDREAERRRADRAERERLQAERDRLHAEHERAQAERERADAVARAERLAARLKELGLDDE
ncbi:Uma2 family endonuclease [Paludisphaera rhizosphaerae]|uniref:Uma2 family endonuclease n=1 Tax=Paludisphaera rhizosphaerae TaxID=2711216 RepID=UPI0013EA07E1|nr:Uma2 family endonuclease [Paludisphaera rhizosphaerae]